MTVRRGVLLYLSPNDTWVKQLGNTPGGKRITAIGLSTNSLEKALESDLHEQCQTWIEETDRYQ